MSKTLSGICMVAIAAGLVYGQDARPVAFEVATVKPCTAQQQSQFPIGLFTYPGGKIRATNYTLKQLIHDAYDLEMFRIVGGPGWVDTERYNVDAQPPESSAASKWVPVNFKTPPNPEMRLMLQNLLAERFQLKMHRESKAESVYALTVGKGGPKLNPPKDATKQPFVSFGRTGAVTAEALSSLLIGKNATMDLLAERLAQVLRRPVTNETGIQGNYDFTIEYAANDTQAAAAPSLSGALQEQAGLKLETRPGSVEVLAIDKAERPGGN